MKELTINERIKLVMDTFGYDEVKFAKKVGASKVGIINVIQNNFDPTYALLRNITTVFPVSQEWLIIGKGKPFTVESVGKWKSMDKQGESHYAVDRDVNRRVKEVREMNNLSQTLFASELSVTRDVISNIENDRNSPPIAIIKSLRSVFRVNPMWLLYGDKPMILKEKGD
jgi:DNA-binding XRE family transcriptional regulator